MTLNKFIGLLIGKKPNQNFMTSSTTGASDLSQVNQKSA
ncbi:hypothetical protein FOL01_p021 (plasmid) [Weissella jogaejeotgali]|uniref:Uncharacterized protein n=1 Tax=Weissella jogaejeotgali TaxID=1631871 RepID=A0A1L6REE6_9LACO|nr:hypothetical protein FOL01_p021 [Weissella jogaejeotgali]